MQQPTITVIGTPISPFVRKILACLDFKGLHYQLDPLLAPLANDQFTATSPLRLIPVIRVGDFSISDSTVICQYIDDRFPDKPLYPTDIEAAAQARWLEEYANTKLFEVLALKLFVHRVLRPQFKTNEPDYDIVEENLLATLPAALDYLEPNTPANGWLLGELSIADMAIGAFARLTTLSDYKIDDNRWPHFAAYFARLMQQPVFSNRFALEEQLLRSALDTHWEVTARLGYRVEDNFR